MRLCSRSRVAALHMSMLASMAFATEDRFMLVCTVLDPAGAAVPWARVTLLSPRQSALDSAMTDEDGRFFFAQVAAGLAKRRVPVRIHGPGTTQVSVRMQIEPLRVELTVSASPGSAESIDSVSQSVNVIEKDAIRERTEAVLAQAALEQTGLALQRTRPTLAGIYVRGLTGNKVSVFLDGVRYTTSAQRGGINTFLDLTGPSALQSIEVLRGPNSAQCGSNAVGGTVQPLSQPLTAYTRRRGASGALETYFNSADLASGSNLAASFSLDRFTFQADSAGRRVSTLRTGKGKDSHCAITRFLGLNSDVLIDGGLPDTAFTQYRGSVKIGWAITPASYLTGYYIRGQQDGGRRYDQLPGGDGNLVADLRDLMLDLAYFRCEKSGLGWFDQFSATYSLNTQREERVNQGGNGNPSAPIQHEYERTTAQGVRAQALKTLGRRHYLSVGSEYYFEGIRTPSFAADPYAPVSVVRRWRIQDNLVLSTVPTCLRARSTLTDLPPDIEGGAPAPDGYLSMRYQRRNGRLWLEPLVHVAARQERLSSLDLEDRRTGATRSRASIRRFLYNGATVRGLVGPGPDGMPGNADDVLLPTGETPQQVQNRGLGPGVESARLFLAVPAYITFGLRAGLRLGEKQDCVIALTNIGDRNYRGISWGLDAAGRSLSVASRIGF